MKNNLNFTIENAKPSDSETICNIRDAEWMRIYPNDKLGITKKDIELLAMGPNNTFLKKRISYYKKLLDDGQNYNHILFLAKIDNKVVGFVEADLIDNLRYLSAIYVKHKFQCRGIGTKLLNRIIDLYGKDNDIYLDVVRYNKQAINCYNKLGFKKTGKTVKPEKNRPSYLKTLPMIEMVLKKNSRSNDWLEAK